MKSGDIMKLRNLGIKVLDICERADEFIDFKKEQRKALKKSKRDFNKKWQKSHKKGDEC